MKRSVPAPCRRLFAGLLLGSVLSLHAQPGNVTTNAPAANPAITNAATNAPVAGHAPERATAISGKLDYAAFKTVAERNIFNGNRSGQRLTSTRSSSQSRSVRVESFSLVGTLLVEGKDPVAFFDGTGSEFRRALKSGGNVGGFIVQEILHAGVRLAQGTNTIEVRVGSGLRREDEGLWKSSESGASYTGGAGSSYSGGGRFSNRGGSSYSRESSRDSSPAGAPPAASADAAEILKRLMEKREKE